MVNLNASRIKAPRRQVVDFVVPDGIVPSWDENENMRRGPELKI